MSVSTSPLSKSNRIPSGASTKRPHILLIDDDMALCKLLEVSLTQQGFSVESAHDIGGGCTRLNTKFFDIILLDLTLGSVNGLDEMPRLFSVSPASRLWVLTGNSSIQAAVRAMKLGASGFFSKDLPTSELARELKAACPNTLTFEEVSESGEQDFSTGLLGNSPAMRKVRQHIYRMKDVDSTILITGESGTGKELIARALHRVSRRRGEKFAAINCGAIPETLLESELFGHKRGSFTDAKADRKGYFELCSNGTLLLDEIGEMPFSLQVKLLRVLQEKEIQPVGSGQTVKVDTRIIASTNRDLSEEVRQGRFREDLFYRLSVLSLESPPLRYRREDIPLLVETFTQRFANRFNKKILRPGFEIMSRLLAYEWPGNVRELQNAIERGVVLSGDGEIHIEDIFQSGLSSALNHENSNDFGGEQPFSVLEYASALECFERNYITKLLKATNGNISEASRISGEYRPHLYRLLKKYCIDPLEFKT